MRADSTGVPRGRVGGSTPLPLNLQNFFVIVCLQHILSKLCSYTHKYRNFLQENVKSCTLISHFASASGGPSPKFPTGALPLDPTGDFCPPHPLALPPTRKSLHCKILGTPIAGRPNELHTAHTDFALQPYSHM